MEVVVRVIAIMPVSSGVSSTGKQWQRMEFIGETLLDKYPRKICFTLFNENVQKLAVQVGFDYTISVDVESESFVGRDGVERWNTRVKPWKVEQYNAMAQQVQPQPQFPGLNQTPPQQVGYAPQMEQPVPQQGFQQPAAQQYQQPYQQQGYAQQQTLFPQQG